MVIRPPWLGGGVCYPGFLSGPCQLALVGLRCLWVPQSCSVYGLRNGVTCLRSGLCSSLVLDRHEVFPSLFLVGLVPGLSVGSPASGWRCVFRHVLVVVAISPMYSFGMWSPFGSIVSFCHS